jgi:hypothetical protein
MRPVQQFYAYADSDRAHGHTVEATSWEGAAVGFMERYSPTADADGEVRVHVRSPETGLEHCFVIDLDDGRVASCD